jgi:LPS sulfotransferase NodH
MLEKFSNKTRALKYLSRFYLKNLALDLNITEGHSDYTKFFILGRSRTGSTFLRSLLNSHPQVVVFGEVFHNTDVQWDNQILPYSRKTRRLAQNDSVKFLNTMIFRRFRKQVAAVGFKIFYYHAHDEKRVPLWAYLKEHTEIKVIHLKRKNVLKTHLSHKKAFLTEQWMISSPSAKKRVNGPIILDEQECLHSFTGTRTWEAEYDAFFKDHPKIEVIYEDLAHASEQEMARIQAFLGIDYQQTKASTFKQSDRPLSEQVTNYFELKHKFMGTPWAEFFEE